MKACWKENPDLVYSVAREATEAWTFVKRAARLRRVPSRPNGAVARVDSVKEEKGVVAG